MSRRALATAALLAAALAGCEPYVQGNGVYAEQARPDVGTFTGVSIDDGIEATVTAGVASQSVMVSGDANVVPQIETQVWTDDGRQVLHVWVSTAYSGTIPPRAVVQVPTLDFAAASHAARINGRQLSAGAFAVQADRSSSVILQGAASPAGSTLAASLATGAVLDATGYAVSSGATVDLSDGSTARLHSDGPVTGTVSGGSVLDDLQGAGTCAGVVADASSKVSCH